ncbi:hypothetical protein B1813_07820 [Saccharomonospora piscinae]|uniref:CBS domain-containing protein n=1 Tax=Saccharomonospora piscinae TaxID=687388 RepID=A0A1V9A7J3_SACPI|nr:hypothetical protein B1813_07820 [Saccharomonospora piscinae]
MVRGGRNGEREEAALREGLAITGWDELGDLTEYENKEQILSHLCQVYPNRKKASLTTWTGQLWRLSREIQLGDHIVMPLKTKPQQLSIGRVVGPYKFRHDAPPQFKNAIEVEWLSVNTPRAAVEQDLLDSMGSLLTICELSRFDAANRIAKLAETGADPGPSRKSEWDIRTPKDLIEKAASAPRAYPMRISIRDLLSCWDQARRTPSSVALVERELAELGLTTSPPFTEGWLDNLVSIIPIEDEPDPSGSSNEDLPQDMGVESATDFPEVSLTFGVLQPSNKEVASVKPEDDINVALTFMVAERYSQLAVIDCSGNFHGAVSWESIGTARMSGPVRKVEDAITSAMVVDFNDHLLTHISEIYRNGYVFVWNRDRTMGGVVTASDLTNQFGALARPFVLIEEAERRLRRRVDAVFAAEELNKYTRTRKSAESAADLTIGNYLHLLRPVENWRRIAWPLDHDMFLETLEEVRKIRNELMHFAPDPVTKEQFDTLDKFVRLLRAVDPYM